MEKIPYQTQIDSAANNLYLTSEFCQKVLRGLSETKMQSLYYESFPTDLHDAGLFKYTDEDELFDTLTFGELCSEVYKLIKTGRKRKDNAEMLAAYPFIKASAADGRFVINDKKRFELQPHNGSSDISLFDPEYLNSMYRLCENSTDARYFYWTRWMTEEQFFSAAYALTSSEKISKIIDDYHADGRSFADRIQYIGEYLGKYEEVMNRYDPPYDSYGRVTFQNLNRAENEKKFFRLTENFIIIPIANIYKLNQKGEIYHD